MNLCRVSAEGDLVGQSRGPGGSDVVDAKGCVQGTRTACRGSEESLQGSAALLRNPTTAVAAACCCCCNHCSAASLPLGVLALLVEAGEAPGTVVAAGEEWLASHRLEPRARDVALSTALAHRAVAEGLAKKQGDAASATAMLEVAGELLRRHRAAPNLQADVAADLAALQPALACQLVALPLERFQERERGVQVCTFFGGQFWGAGSWLAGPAPAV